MERMFSILPFVLFGMYSVLPLGSLITWFTNYSLSLGNYYIYAVITAFVSVITAVTIFFSRTREITRLKNILILLLFPLSIINWICYIIPAGWKFAALCMLPCSVCALIYMVKYIKQKKGKTIVLIISVLIFIPLVFLSFLDCLFGNFGSSTVVQEVYSPDGKYKAEVINSDQGALGGDTSVCIYNTHAQMDLYFLKISKKPQYVYSGAWDGYKDMEIYWKDSCTLFINGTEYLAG